MPVFRFNKAFGIARNLKVFLNLHSGVTRGALPDAEDVERYKEQAQKLSNARQLIKEQRQTLRHKERMISGLENMLYRKDKFQLNNMLRAKEWWTAGEPVPEALPDFAIIGAQKCGTTFLYNLLTQHPNVEGAFEKELHFFDRRFDRGIEWYRSQFPLPIWTEERKSITGEATPDYLIHPHAARRMAKVMPQARLIVLLRNPTDRAYSHYHHNMTRKGREPLKFEEALEAEEARLRGERDKILEDEHYDSFNHRHFSYLFKGIYVDQLLRWSRFFGQEQMLVLKSEDFYERTPETLKLVLDFLRLPDWQPDGASNISNKGHYKREMNPATRRRLEDYFEPHNRRLYEYLGVDLGW